MEGWKPSSKVNQDRATARSLGSPTSLTTKIEDNLLETCVIRVFGLHRISHKQHRAHPKGRNEFRRSADGRVGLDGCGGGCVELRGSDGKSGRNNGDGAQRGGTTRRFGRRLAESRGVTTTSGFAWRHDFRTTWGITRKTALLV